MSWGALPKTNFRGCESHCLLTDELSRAGEKKSDQTTRLLYMYENQYTYELYDPRADCESQKWKRVGGNEDVVC